MAPRRPPSASAAAPPTPPSASAGTRTPPSGSAGTRMRPSGSARAPRASRSGYGAAEPTQAIYGGGNSGDPGGVRRAVAIPGTGQSDVATPPPGGPRRGARPGEGRRRPSSSARCRAGRARSSSRRPAAWSVVLLIGAVALFGGGDPEPTPPQAGPSTRPPAAELSRCRAQRQGHPGERAEGLERSERRGLGRLRRPAGQRAQGPHPGREVRRPSSPLGRGGRGRPAEPHSPAPSPTSRSA